MHATWGAPEALAAASQEAFHALAVDLAGEPDGLRLELAHLGRPVRAAVTSVPGKETAPVQSAPPELLGRRLVKRTAQEAAVQSSGEGHQRGA